MERPELAELLERVRRPAPPPVPMRQVVRVTLEIPEVDFQALSNHAQHEKISVEALLERLLRAVSKAARENAPQ